MFPENVFKRVPAELPAGQCSAVTRLKYVLWKLVYDASATEYWYYIFPTKNDQTYFFSESPVNNADAHSTLHIQSLSNSLRIICTIQHTEHIKHIQMAIRLEAIYIKYNKNSQIKTPQSQPNKRSDYLTTQNHSKSIQP